MDNRLNIRIWRGALSGVLVAALFLLPSMAPAQQVQSSPRPTRQQGTSSQSAKTKKPRAQPPKVATATASSLEVIFKDGLLSITATDAAILDALERIHQSTGATIITPSGIVIQDKVTVHLGPAPPAQVMIALLQGTRFDYVIAGSPADPLALTSVLVTIPSTQAQAPPAAASTAPVEPKPGVADDPPQETRTQTVANLTGGDEGANERVEVGTPVTPPASEQAAQATSEQPAQSPVPK